MGCDKALLEIAGVPLWRRQRDLLAEAGAAEIFLSARDNQSWTYAATADFAAIVRDIESDCGPLAGIVAAFDRVTHPQLAVLAIDLPRVPAAYWRKLVAAATNTRGVVPAWPDGRVEPLCAIYPEAAAEVASRQLETGQLAMQDFVAVLEKAGQIARVPIETDEAGYFLNWNEPADASSGIPLTPRVEPVDAPEESAAG
jgi:molybdopterin-guanine dinucleotide biosynthesis protein A